MQAHVFVGARPSRLTATPGSPAASAAVAGPVRIAPTVCSRSVLELEIDGTLVHRACISPKGNCGILWQSSRASSVRSHLCRPALTVWRPCILAHPETCQPKTQASCVLTQCSTAVLTPKP